MLLNCGFLANLQVVVREKQRKKFKFLQRLRNKVAKYASTFMRAKKIQVTNMGIDRVVNGGHLSSKS